MNSAELDAYVQALMERNAQQLAECKARMGNKWLLHPDNYVRRKDENAQVL